MVMTCILFGVPFLQRCIPNLDAPAGTSWTQYHPLTLASAPPPSARLQAGRAPDGAAACPTMKFDEGCRAAGPASPGAVRWAAADHRAAAAPWAVAGPWTSEQRAPTDVAALPYVKVEDVSASNRARATGASFSAVGRATGVGVLASTDAAAAAAAAVPVVRPKAGITGGTAAAAGTNVTAGSRGAADAGAAVMAGAMGTTSAVWQLFSMQPGVADECGDVPILRLTRPAVAPEQTPSLPNGRRRV